jgi:hypothetical protein
MSSAILITVVIRTEGSGTWRCVGCSLAVFGMWCCVGCSLVDDTDVSEDQISSIFVVKINILLSST